MHYEDDGDETVAVGEPCPMCGSHATEYRLNGGFWKCEDCSTIWDCHLKDEEAFDDGTCCLDPRDPDYDYVKYIASLPML